MKHVVIRAFFVKKWKKLYKFVTPTKNVFRKKKECDMKDIGIVRKIDELGRIVIPKEIRKIEGLKEGSPVEIFTNQNGEILLKKYSPVFELKEYAEDVCQSIGDTLETITMVCDMEKIIAVSNIGKSYLDKKISQEIIDTLSQRKNVIVNKEDNSNMFSIIGEEISFSSQIIVPIISQGDLYGGLIAMKKEGELSVSEVNVLKAFSNFLARQINI